MLVVGYDTVNQTTLYVNGASRSLLLVICTLMRFYADPFYPSISYDYSEMSDLLLYTMK